MNRRKTEIKKQTERIVKNIEKKSRDMNKWAEDLAKKAKKWY